MGTTTDKLNKVLESKAAIKAAIEAKGVSDVGDVMSTYAEKIGQIQSGGNLQEKSVSLSFGANKLVKPDEGFDGLSLVTVTPKHKLVNFVGEDDAFWPIINADLGSVFYDEEYGFRDEKYKARIILLIKGNAYNVTPIADRVMASDGSIFDNAPGLVEFSDNDFKRAYNMNFLVLLYAESPEIKLSQLVEMLYEGQLLWIILDNSKLIYDVGGNVIFPRIDALNGGGISAGFQSLSVNPYPSIETVNIPLVSSVSGRAPAPIIFQSVNRLSIKNLNSTESQYPIGVSNSPTVLYIDANWIATSNTQWFRQAFPNGVYKIEFGRFNIDRWSFFMPKILNAENLNSSYDSLSKALGLANNGKIYVPTDNTISSIDKSIRNKISEKGWTLVNQ